VSGKLLMLARHDRTDCLESTDILRQPVEDEHLAIVSQILPHCYQLPRLQYTLLVVDKAIRYFSVRCEGTGVIDVNFKLF
jgi:hypothetical protein